ncbi:hypothetical protein O0I10_008147 [Lichtheimia ornata]|uniref:Uncharacterized protein n=1 Tax=Lichtheimia ornata TaxID=688661 RepID=A0AAD7XT95_9FUNG|nr:uncharacterized protein O0I10_008147 [Lichtheimia ornata]KAJ8656134.1 hypothetical protein O0I10_008147 [Lichtheimia ornata]
MKFLTIAVICAIASAASAATTQGGGQSGGQVDGQTGGQAGGNTKKPCEGRTDEECVEPECYKYIGVTHDPKANAGERWGYKFECQEPRP